MRIFQLFVALPILVTASPVLASPCSDAIASLEAKLNSEGMTAGATSSSGQATAAARSGKAVEAKETGTPVSDLAKPPTAENMQATKQTAAAGAAGEGVMQAKVTLNEARNADNKGDAQACGDAVAKAKQQARQ